MQQAYSYLDEYRIIKTLGAGYTSKVKLAVGPDKKYVAIKRFKSVPEEDALNQIHMLQKLHHQNIVNMISVRPNGFYKKKNGLSYNCYALILQYAEGGELFDFIAQGGRFDAKLSRTYLLQILSALSYMHLNGVVHRDLKPENILLSYDYSVKIADFGFSTLLEGKDKSGILHTKLGTAGYNAPQIRSKNYKGTQVDIFAVGVILFIMFSCHPPFKSTEQNDDFFKIIKAKQYGQFWFNHCSNKPKGFYPPAFKDLINRMIAYNPILIHEWVVGPVLSKSELVNEQKFRKMKVEEYLAQERRNKQQKRKKRNQLIEKKVIQKKVESVEPTEDEIFIKHLEQHEDDDQVFKIKTFVRQGDKIYRETQQIFLTTLKTLFQHGIRWRDQFHSYNFKGTETRIKNSYLVKFVDQNGIYVKMNILVYRTFSGSLYLKFKKIQGDYLYHKLLVKHIRQELAYCLVQE